MTHRDDTPGGHAVTLPDRRAETANQSPTVTFGPVGPKSRQVLAHSTARIEAYEGAVRSSKTITSILDFARFLRSGPPGEFAIVGRTERTAERNIIEPMVAMFGKRHVRYNRGLGKLTVFGRTGYLIGANNEASRTKVQGLTLVALYLDEAATLPQSFFQMARSRLSVPGAKIWLTANPEGRQHWLLTDWLAKACLWIKADGTVEHNPDGIDLHRYTYTIDDNDYLDPAFVTELKRSYSGVWFRRYILSEWTNAEGAVYDCYDPARHVIAWAQLPRMVRLLGAGVDYGTTNASVALILGLGEDGRVYLVDEWSHRADGQQVKWTDGQQSAAVRAWLAQPHTPHEHQQPVEWVFVDPAAASFKTQLYYDGQRNVADADNDVVGGIKTVASLLASGHLLIADRCAALIEEMPGYAWDPKATAKGEDKPIKLHDHAVDAARYVVHSTENVWRPLLHLLPAAA